MQRAALPTLLVLACTEPEPQAAAGCDGMPAFCQSDRVLRVCEDDGWVPRSCKDECAAVEGSLAFGCVTRPDGDDMCNCELDSPANPEPDPCAPGEEEAAECTFDGGRQLWSCVEGMRVTIACAEICDTAHDVGCFYDPVLEEDACACAMPGDPCDILGYPTCVGDGLLRCADDSWELVPCPACADRPTCVTDMLGVGACSCSG